MSNPNPKRPPPNKAGVRRGPTVRTLERMARAERALVETKQMERKLAKDLLEEGALYFRGLMARFQPGTERYNEDIFWRASVLQFRYSAALAPYQSPTYRSVYFSPEVINQAQISEDDARARMRHVLGIVAPQMLDDDPNPEQEHDDEAELIMSNGGGAHDG
jgi:hypothetical protein